MTSSYVESDAIGGRDYVAPDLVPVRGRERLRRQAPARHAARLARACLLNDALMLAIAMAIVAGIAGH